jgi:aconitase B
VHFRDLEMIRQIEEKVVNRLRQVTSAIEQDGANQVSIIKSTAERQAATEFARAAAQRPLIVGKALQQIAASGDGGHAETPRCSRVDVRTLLETHRRAEKLLRRQCTTSAAPSSLRSKRMTIFEPVAFRYLRSVASE